MDYVYNVSVLQDLLDVRAQVYAEAPQKDIHAFVGTYKRVRLYRIPILLVFKVLSLYQEDHLPGQVVRVND